MQYYTIVMWVVLSSWFCTHIILACNKSRVPLALHIHTIRDANFFSYMLKEMSIFKTWKIVFNNGVGRVCEQHIITTLCEGQVVCNRATSSRWGVSPHHSSRQEAFWWACTTFQYPFNQWGGHPNGGGAPWSPRHPHPSKRCQTPACLRHSPILRCLTVSSDQLARARRLPLPDSSGRSKDTSTCRQQKGDKQWLLYVHDHDPARQRSNFH